MQRRFEPVAKDLCSEDPSTLPAVGFSVGFPYYQTSAIAAPVPAQFVGAQRRGSWTPVGAYVGGQFRVYPRIPVPISFFVVVGGSIYGSNTSYYFALCTRVPLGKKLHLDFEGGAANSPQLTKRLGTTSSLGNELRPSGAVGAQYTHGPGRPQLALDWSGRLHCPERTAPQQGLRGRRGDCRRADAQRQMHLRQRLGSSPLSLHDYPSSGQLIRSERRRQPLGQRNGSSPARARALLGTCAFG